MALRLLTRHPRAVLLDALGTLLELEPPAPRLRHELRERLGIELTPAQARHAIGAEIAYYLAHNHEGSDLARLADLRRRCAAVLRDALGPPGAGRSVEELLPALLAALSFRPFADVSGALAALRARGLRLVVVSNWDVSLHEVLERTGLTAKLDGAIASAEAASAKPAPQIFARALALAGADPDQAIHVGDSLANDVAGARAAGVEPVLVARDGAPAGRLAPPVVTVGSLGELVERWP